MLTEDFIYTSVIGLTRGVNLKGIKLLILRETEGEECMPLIINEEEFFLISDLLSKKTKTDFEFIDKLTKAFNLSLDTIELVCEHYGTHQCFVYFSDNNHLRRLSLSLPTCIALSLHYNIPLRVDRQTFTRATHVNRHPNQMAFPLGDMTNELLEEAEKSAVTEENYELARLLRNELLRRKNL